MSKQLIYEINNKKYLLFELPVTKKTEKETVQKIKDCNGILQGVGDLNPTFGYSMLSILIPEEYIHDFNQNREGCYESSNPSTTMARIIKKFI